jgi:hypothetical protein
LHRCVAELLDWLPIQLGWALRARALVKLQSPASGPRLEEALQFLNGPGHLPFAICH